MDGRPRIAGVQGRSGPCSVALDYYLLNAVWSGYPDWLDSGRKVGLDVVVEPLLAVRFGLPSLDDPPSASGTRSAGMGDEPVGGSYERHQLAHHARVDLLG